MSDILGTKNDEVTDENLDTGILGQFVIYKNDSDRKIDYITLEQQTSEPEEPPQTEESSEFRIIAATTNMALEISSDDEEEIKITNDALETQYPIIVTTFNSNYEITSQQTLQAGQQMQTQVSLDIMLNIQSEGIT